MKSGPKQTSSHFLQQREFMVAMGRPVSTIPGDAKPEDIALAKRLIDEEVNKELFVALDDLSIPQYPRTAVLAEILDGAVDAVYVIYQLCNTLGLPFDEAFEEVHRANMAKRMPDGTVHYRDDGKVLKPAGWKPPSIEAIILRHFSQSEDHP